MATERDNKAILTTLITLINGTLANNFKELSTVDAAINENIARLQSILATVNSSLDTVSTGLTAVGTTVGELSDEVDALKEGMQSLELVDSVTEEGDSAVKSSGIYSFVKAEANTIQTAVDEEVSRIDEELTKVGTQLEGLKPALTVTEDGTGAVASSGVYTFVTTLIEEAVSNIVDNAVKVLSSDEDYTDENYPTAKAVIEYVKSMVGAATRVDIKVVDALPAIADAVVNTFYFVPAANASGSNYFDEYVFVAAKGEIESHFELVGSTQIDLSNYVTIEKLTEAIEALKTELVEKIDALEAKVDLNETNATNNYNSITTELTEVKNSLTTLETTVNDMSTNVTDLSTNVTDLTTNVTNLTTTVNNLNTIINGDTESGTSSLADRLTAVETSTSSLDTRVTALESGAGSGGDVDLTEIEGRLDTLEADVGTAKTDLATLTSTVNGFADDIDAATTAASSAETKADAAYETAANASADAADATTAANAASTKADTNATNITNLTSRVTTLEANTTDIEAMTAAEIQAIYNSVFGA